MLFPVRDNRAVYHERRNTLLKKIKSLHPHLNSGKILLFSNFSREQERFNQDGTFLYFSGVQEPGSLLLIDWNGQTTLYIPNTEGYRNKWIESALEATPEQAEQVGVDSIELLGKKIHGYELAPFFSYDDYESLIATVQNDLSSGCQFFICNPESQKAYFEQRFAVQRLIDFVPALAASVKDISGLVADMRMIKSSFEIDMMYNAIDITATAHDGAISMIADGRMESEVQAAVEYVFTMSGATPAFPTIVGAGQNSTVLHYTSNNKLLADGELVVVDCGARANGYCADITRTYPISGKFSPRQKEIYQIVLDCQEYIAELAQPGMWLVNKDKPEQSLTHLAQQFFARHGLEKYFIHGIGHFLGMDAHDVGDISRPLEEGCVITIEPGLYIPEEQIGIRIEDNYWIVVGGAVCLSEALQKSVSDVERAMKKQ
jgi:Xaa-Pro aminopeptidase